MTKETGTQWLRCLCGEMHEVVSEFQGIPVILCPMAPPGFFYLKPPMYKVTP